MKTSKKLIKICTVLTFLLFTSITSYANDSKDILIDHIFTQEQGLWYPGKSESKDFYITNNKQENISIDRLYIELKEVRDSNTNHTLNSKTKQFRELAKNSTLKLSYKDTVLFEDSLDNLLPKKGIVLSKEIHIKSNEKALLNMTLNMNKEMNNDAQGLESIFGIGVSYKVDDTKPPVEPPINPPVNPEPPIEPPVKPEIPIDPDTGIGGEADKLPQTGGIINSASLLALGTIAIGTGVALNKKSSQEKGGKHHE